VKTVIVSFFRTDQRKKKGSQTERGYAGERHQGWRGKLRAERSLKGGSRKKGVKWSALKSGVP